MVARGSGRRLAPAVLTLQDIPTAVPGVRFAVRFSNGGHPDHLDHLPDDPHPLAGTGKLFLALAVARLAQRDPELLAVPLTIRAGHREGARSGTLRLMSGELALTVDDAMALIVGTGDGACVLALVEVLRARGVDVLGTARDVAADLGLSATELTALETGESFGEGLTGTTTPGDLCALLVHLTTAGPAAANGPPSVLVGEAADGPAVPDGAERVSSWMDMAFEPAGLASALPGYGPRTVPHRTVAGVELLAPDGAPGCASVLMLPADVGTGRPAACVAAYHPGVRADGSPLVPLEISAALGSLGLAVARESVPSRRTHPARSAGGSVLWEWTG